MITFECASCGHKRLVNDELACKKAKFLIELLPAIGIVWTIVLGILVIKYCFMPIGVVAG
jgi:hypothetical protein